MIKEPTHPGTGKEGDARSPGIFRRVGSHVAGLLKRNPDDAPANPRHTYEMSMLAEALVRVHGLNQDCLLAVRAIAQMDPSASAYSETEGIYSAKVVDPAIAEVVELDTDITSIPTGESFMPPFFKSDTDTMPWAVMVLEVQATDPSSVLGDGSVVSLSLVRASHGFATIGKKLEEIGMLDPRNRDVTQLKVPITPDGKVNVERAPHLKGCNIQEILRMIHGNRQELSEPDVIELAEAISYEDLVTLSRTNQSDLRLRLIANAIMGRYGLRFGRQYGVHVTDGPSGEGKFTLNMALEDYGTLEEIGDTQE